MQDQFPWAVKPLGGKFHWDWVTGLWSGDLRPGSRSQLFVLFPDVETSVLQNNTTTTCSMLYELMGGCGRVWGVALPPASTSAAASTRPAASTKPAANAAASAAQCPPKTKVMWIQNTEPSLPPSPPRPFLNRDAVCRDTYIVLISLRLRLNLHTTYYRALLQWALQGHHHHQLPVPSWP